MPSAERALLQGRILFLVLACAVRTSRPLRCIRDVRPFLAQAVESLSETCKSIGLYLLPRHDIVRAGSVFFDAVLEFG